MSMAALLLLTWLPALQAAAPTPPAPPPAAAEPLLNADGEPARPGELPRGTAQEARALWLRLLECSLALSAERRPVRAFELRLDLRYKASAARTNDVGQVSYRFLAPGYLRVRMGPQDAPARELLRGPRGDWLIDTKVSPPQKVDLSVGREHAQDLRQLDEISAVARNFVGLTDPATLRIVRLARCAPPTGLPRTDAGSAAELDWIELLTPDLSPGRDASHPSGAAPTALTRVRLGLERAGGGAVLALVEEAAAGERLSAGSALLALSRFAPVDGLRVPHQIHVWLAEVPGGVPAAAPAFGREPSLDMLLLEARLRTALAPESFLP